MEITGPLIQSKNCQLVKKWLKILILYYTLWDFLYKKGYENNDVDLQGVQTNFLKEEMFTIDLLTTENSLEHPVEKETWDHYLQIQQTALFSYVQLFVPSILF